MNATAKTSSTVETLTSSKDGRKRAELQRVGRRWYVRCYHKTCTRWAQEEFEHFPTRTLATAFIADYFFIQ